jgi:hypothetical protein
MEIRRGKQPLMSGYTVFALLTVLMIEIALLRAGVPGWVDVVLLVLAGATWLMRAMFLAHLRHTEKMASIYNETFRRSVSTMGAMHQDSVTALSEASQRRVELLQANGYRLLPVGSPGNITVFAINGPAYQQLSEEEAEYWQVAEQQQGRLAQLPPGR